MESSKKKDITNTKLTLSLSPTLLSLLQNKQIQKKFSSWIKTRIEFLSELTDKEQVASEFLMRNIKNNYLYWEKCSGNLIERFKNLSISGNLDILTCAATHGSVSYTHLTLPTNREV